MRQGDIETTLSKLRAWMPALLLVLGIALARTAYLAWFCPYELVEDEAFYWEWSRHMAWSYNTKGPGIAWAIWLATSVFGVSELAIRSVAVASSMVGTLAVTGLTLDLTERNRKAGLLAAAAFNLVPAYQAAGLLSTIDGPYIACWAVACWAGYRALLRASFKAWLILGVALGLGFLFKYTILLLLLGMAIFAFWRWRALDVCRRVELAVVLFVALLTIGALPVVIWNWQNDWPTVKHLLGHVGLSASGQALPATEKKGGGWHYQPRWTLELLGVQLAIIGPALAAMVLATVAAVRVRATALYSWPRAELLLWCAAPIFAFYLGVSIMAPVEGNWPIAGFVSLLPLAVSWCFAESALGVGRDSLLRPRGASRFIMNAALVYGACAGLGALRLDLARDGLLRLASGNTPTPATGAGAASAAAEPARNPGLLAGLARAIPVGRLIGGKAMAAHVDRLADRVLEETVTEPFVLAQHYGRGAQLAFYLRGRPVVRIASSRVGGRVVQQDYWPSHSVDDPILKDRPAIIIADFDQIEVWKPAFDRVERIGELDGGTRGSRFGFIGYGYKGLPPPPAEQHY